MLPSLLEQEASAIIMADISIIKDGDCEITTGALTVHPFASIIYTA
jgi:hypothetical protein